MFPHVGFPELLVILAIVVLIFGVNKLPQLGDSFGRAIRNFKRSLRHSDEIDVTPSKEVTESTGGRPDDRKA